MVAPKRKRDVDDDGEPKSAKPAKDGKAVINGNGSKKNGTTHVDELSEQDDAAMDEDEDDAENESGGFGTEDEDEDSDAANPLDTSPSHTTHRPPAHAPTAFRAPTAQELTLLKAANDLYKSGGFKLKIDSLLPSVLPPTPPPTSLTDLLHSLRSLILSLPSLPPASPHSADQLLEAGVQIPWPDPPPAKDVKWTVGGGKVRDVVVCGSWGAGVGVAVGRGKRREWGVDLGVVLSPDTFPPKSHLANRFFHQRAFLLAHLLSHLLSSTSLLSEWGLSASFHSPSSDPRRASIVLSSTPGSKAPKGFKLHLRLILPHGEDLPFPRSHASPSRANLRSLLPTPSATPITNTLLLSSSLPVPLLVRMHAFAKDIPSYRPALALLRLWASRRGFGPPPTSSSPSPSSSELVLGFEESRSEFWALLLGGLIEGFDAVGTGKGAGKGVGKGKLARGMSEYQLFRGVVDWLRGWDAGEEGVFMRGGGEVFPTQEYREFHPAVFVESEGLKNLLFGVPLSSLSLLKYEASVSMKLMDEREDGRSEGAFEGLFIREVGVEERFDAVFRIDISHAEAREDLTASTLDHGSHHLALLHSISNTLQRALTTRIRAIALLHTPLAPWSPTSPTPSPSSTITLGLVLDPSQSSRLVDHGPPAEDPDAAEIFREFWGEKAELRRFKDGRILESVVWEASDADARAAIPSRIVEYVLERHFGIGAEDVRAFQGGLDGMLRLPESAVQALAGVPPEGTAFSHALEAYDQLVKSLKALSGLPLALLSVTPSSPGLRHTAPFPPLPIEDIARLASLPDCLRHVPVQDIVLEFEGSGKWPEDGEAVQRVKLAFLEEMASGLLAAEEGKVQYAGVAKDRHAREGEDCWRLEVVGPSGIAFAARIHHPRERVLLERAIADKTTAEPDRKRAQVLLQSYMARFVDGPQHHAAIMTLHHHFPSYAPTVRLVTRWLSAHLLAPHISTELVELICARVFLSPGPCDAPGSTFAGFARVLRLLGTWNWMSEPLFVPVYSARDADPGVRVPFPAEKRDKAWKEFERMRKTDLAGERRAWWVVTEEEAEEMRGKEGPSAVVCRRITVLARKCHQLLADALVDSTVQLPTLFNSPDDAYDFILHLEPSVLPRYYQNLKANEDLWSKRIGFRNLPETKASAFGNEVRIDFDPAQLFFEDLQCTYGDSCVLFYDPLGGDKIAGIWNPSLLKPTPFKVLLGFSSQPDSSDQNGASSGTANGSAPKRPVKLNTAAILNEMARAGEGLVRSIKTKSSV